MVTRFLTTILFAGASLDQALAAECPVTEPGNVRLSNDALVVVLPEDKRFVFSADSSGFLDQHGALGIKVGWYRVVSGQLSISGRRLDGTSRKVRGWISDGYGDSGFQTSYVLFPSPGCWEVVGSVGPHRLVFVVEVELVGAGPSARIEGPQPGWRQTGG